MKQVLALFAIVLICASSALASQENKPSELYWELKKLFESSHTPYPGNNLLVTKEPFQSLFAGCTIANTSGRDAVNEHNGLVAVKGEITTRASKGPLSPEVKFSQLVIGLSWYFTQLRPYTEFQDGVLNMNGLKAHNSTDCQGEKWGDVFVTSTSQISADGRSWELKSQCQKTPFTIARQLRQAGPYLVLRIQATSREASKPSAPDTYAYCWLKEP